MLLRVALVLQSGHSGDACLSPSILFKYECTAGCSGGGGGGVVSELCTLSGMVFVTVVFLEVFIYG